MSIYNADELEAPAWINGDFLKKVLENCENTKDLKIITYDISPASIKGDHYASIMLRCRIKYRLGNAANTLEKSLVIKTIPSGEGIKRDMLMDTNVFETEIKMLSETLPRIEKILADCGEVTKLGPRVYYHALEPHKVVVLEDLCEAGFDVVRARELTEAEVKPIYTKLAQLHAVTYMLGHSDHPDLVTQYQKGIFNSNMKIVEDMVESGLRSFLSLLEEHKDLNVYGKKIKPYIEAIHATCQDLYNAYNLNPTKSEIFVLNHGDFHCKNMMFKFNDKDVLEDVIMVDFQLSCYAPATIDTIYSHYMILSPDLRMRRHEFTKYYFTEFTRILKKIMWAGELPKFEDLQATNLKYRHFAIFLIAVFLPLVFGMWDKSLDDLKDVDVVKMIESPDMIADMYHSPAYIEDLRKHLAILLDEGFLEE